MSSCTTTGNDPQNRAQRRLVFEGFNVPDSTSLSRRHHSSAGTMFTSTPDHKLHEKDYESLDCLQSHDGQPPESCLSQLQSARQLLHSMSRSQILPINELALNDAQQPRAELPTDTNPELAYYKSSLDSERNRRKQLETLVDVQQQRLSEAESELIQLRANDHKKTLCMKQLEQMIPNVVDEWKQKEQDYKAKLNAVTQQAKQAEQTNREKVSLDKKQNEEQLNEKNSVIERIRKDYERAKLDHESAQLKTNQHESRVQQLIKESEQAKQRWATLEGELRDEIKHAENRAKEIQSDLEKKQQDFERVLQDQQKSHADHQSKGRQLENELEEQRRENNVLKMELELREAKYRAQMESLRIQLIRDAETKLAQRVEEQRAKHVQIEEELNELHRRKLIDLEEKYEHSLSTERDEHEHRIQTLLSQLDQMKNELEHLQSTTMTERQDLARKLQDVFETALFKGSTKGNPGQHNTTNTTVSSAPMTQSKSNKSLVLEAQRKDRHELLQPLPVMTTDSNDMSTIRSLSSRIDSLVDQTNRLANGFEFNAHVPHATQQEKTYEWIDSQQKRSLSSQSHSTLQSPFFRSTPIDPAHDWFPPSLGQPSQDTLSRPMDRSHSADPTSSGLFSTYSSYPLQQQPSNSYSVDSHSYPQQPMASYRSSSSLSTNFIDHQQEVRATISKDSIDKQHDESTTHANESLSRYVKMLLERSPTQDRALNNSDHPLAKTNRSLHDIRLSIEHSKLAERDSKAIIDDLAHPMQNGSHSSNSLTPRQQKSAPSKQNGGKSKKRLDYDGHNAKQSNANEFFDRLAQPKTRSTKDKPKPSQLPPPPHPQQPAAAAQGVWK